MPRAPSGGVGPPAREAAAVRESTGGTAQATMPIRAAPRPAPSQTTGSASRPSAGVARVRAASAGPARATPRGTRRAGRAPSGTAMTSTRNAESAVSSMCCHSASDTRPSDSA